MKTILLISSLFPFFVFGSTIKKQKTTAHQVAMPTLQLPVDGPKRIVCLPPLRCVTIIKAYTPFNSYERIKVESVNDYARKLVPGVY